MRLVIRIGGAESTLAVASLGDDVTLGELISHALPQVRLATDQSLWVDGHPCRPETTVAGFALMEGALISDTAPTLLPDSAPWSVWVIGGVDAGRVVGLTKGETITIGRSPQADICVSSPSVSWSHAAIRWDGESLRIKDLDSSNGTRVNGRLIDSDGMVVEGDTAIIVVGGAALAVRRDSWEARAPKPGSLRNITHAGTAPFNRPPRPGQLPEPSQIDPPVKKSTTAATRFSWASVLAPLLMAGAMVAVMGNPRYAVIALLSPVIAVATYFEQKRRAKKDDSQEDERFAGALDSFRDDIAAAGEVKRRLLTSRAPDPATVMARVTLPATTLWQRRSDANDFGVLHAGTGDLKWTPPVDVRNASGLEDEVRVLAGETIIKAAPIEIDLTGAGVVGICGERAGALALARSLLAQAATHVGPADLAIGVFADRGRDEAWRWTSWLPHARQLSGNPDNQWISFDSRSSQSMLQSLRDGIDNYPTPAFLLVIDSEVLTEGRDAPARHLLGHGRHLTESTRRGTDTRVGGIVVAATADQLPASCSYVIHVEEDASVRMEIPEERRTIDGITLAGISEQTAAAWARGLAHFDDPEMPRLGQALPGLVSLLPLLGLEELSAETVDRLWRQSTDYSTPVGVSEAGDFVLDLVRDGPHGLVGGTTGSGKSEFLRSLVAGLAARTDPEHLTFILIDFKGGAAFAACDQLPHTIGTISNLDEQLANRALRALEAEMRYRQEVFAAAGENVDNLDAYLATNPAEPMPRLLLVVDEFAQLAKEFPDVLSSLVSVAAVGRTLGVHMILATQRPAGVVSEDILANTNMRVALRVQSRDDSVNVIGVPQASSIGRDQRGRAFIKLGEDDISPIQTALVTGRSGDLETARIDADEILLGVPLPPKKPRPPSSKESDLDRLIAAIRQANAQRGFAPPRRVWPEALGERVNLLLEGCGVVGGQPPGVGTRGEDQLVCFALSDDPDRQRQIPSGWDLDEGNLLLMGIPGSGTSTSLKSLALSLADRWSPEELDLLVLDLGAGELAELQALPQCGAYVGTGSSARELQERLLRYLRDEFNRRLSGGGATKRTVVLIDGLATLKDDYQDVDGLALLESFFRVWADGPDMAIHCAATTTRAKSVPSRIDEVTTQKWLFRLADPYDYSVAGVVKGDAPAAVPGRCVVAETRFQTQVAIPRDGFPAAIGAIATRHHVPETRALIASLPESVTTADVAALAEMAGEPWRIPIGIAEADLAPAYLETYEGEHILIAGPARSSKSGLLLAVGEKIRDSARKTGHRVEVWGIGGRRSPLLDADLDSTAPVGDTAGMLALARVSKHDVVLLIDDAEQIDDGDQAITGLLNANLPHLHVVAAGRSDELRNLYGHWTKIIRKSRCGVLLQPDVDFDGDLLGVRIPRRPPVAMSVGRGYACVAGKAVLLQSMVRVGTALE